VWRSAAPGSRLSSAQEPNPSRRVPGRTGAPMTLITCDCHCGGARITLAQSTLGPTGDDSGNLAGETECREPVNQPTAEMRTTNLSSHLPLTQPL